MRRFRAWWGSILLGGVGLAALVPPVPIAAQEPPQQRVLALYVTSPGAVGAAAFESVYQKTFGAALGSRLDFHSEFIDLARFSEPSYADALAAFLRYKYRRLPPDVIMATTEAARVTASAQAQIEAERQSALVSLRSEVGTLAIDLASGVIGESLTDDRKAQNVVDRFLADLEASEQAAAGGKK